MGKIVYTQGSFDILHSGHMNILRKCRNLAEGDGKVIIGLTTDECYERYRGYKPAKEFKERKALLEALRFVDEVLPVDNRETKKQINKINPDFAVVGSDWVAKDIYKQWNMLPEELNPILVYFPYTTNISSTMIKERIKNAK